MKKLIGIILAICMLSTMAFAAEITDAAATATGMKVTVTYTALADNAQATMLAYKVADTATADDEETLAYVDQTNTPIVGIDQEASDGSFEFTLAEGFTGKVVIKVGGAGVTTPDTVLLLDFFETEEPVKTITIVLGDVNGDGKANGTDATAIKGFAKKLTSSKKEEYNTANNYKCGVEYVTADGTKYVLGDVNGDGKANGTDATAIKGFAKKLTSSKKEEYNTANNYKCGVEVVVIDNTAN